MNIVVCVKQVPDTWAERTLRPDDSRLDRASVDGVINELDEYAIEEGLRWNSPVMMISRTPRHRLELCGVTIDPGDHVGVNLVAANRDQAMFERPDEFDMHRGTRNHSAFGLGPHICLGQHLARNEMAAALNLLLDRLPKIRFDDRYPPPEVCGFMLRGPASLHVRFD